MKYSKEWLISHSKNSSVKYLFFWGHQKATDGSVTASCFSQWYESPFVVDGVTYLTAEHWMMAQKALLFHDTKAYNAVIAADTPGKAKAIGREVQNFDEVLWIDKREEIVLAGSLHKFGQHLPMKTFLLNTGDRVLVEASPVDFIWGIGLSKDDARSLDPLKWRGDNLLGFTLMEARDKLK
ncbi:MAG: NADAR family protein [Bacteroidetes bacterium]|nr:NADAR family protein [Bacteroidota bacterium]